MALNKSTLLIRDYENIRSILRDVYIYGCFSKDDYVEKQGISGRKYDKEQQRISAYLPKKFIRKRRIDKKVVLYCTYDGMESSENYLADTYRNKSFTALDVMSFFFVQELLNETPEMTAGEILDLLPNFNKEVIFTKDNLRVKLDELVDKGFITIIKDGRNVKYKLSDDIWSEFNDDELLDVCTYLEFMKNVSPIEMPYCFLYDKVMLYLRTERGIKVPECKIFSFKHSHLFNVLDNDVLLEILRAKASSRLIKVADSYGQKAKSVIPGEIVHDSVYGRQYVYCYYPDEDRYLALRIDKIGELTIDREMTDEEQSLANKMASYSDECWATSSYGDNASEVVIQFMFDEEKEQYILRRIETEGHGGAIEKKSDGLYEYKISVRDPDEMIPWIRSFGERAKLISSGERKTEEKIKEDWKRALDKYDSL